MTIGVDLGGTNIRAGIRKGDVITDYRQAPLEEKNFLDKTLGQLTDLLRPLVSEKIRGIGIAVPSIVDAEKGIVYNVVNIPSWERVELRSILEGTFGVPVGVENDANCFAWGEHLHGKARGHQNVVGITLGTGVGAGLILNGNIYRGRNGGAGEVGYLNYLDRDFEFYGGSFFFSDVHGTSAVEVYRNAAAGETKALTIWADYGVHIGRLVKSLVYAYDPEAVVFGGSIAKAWEFFEPSMRRTISSDFHFPLSMKHLEISRSENEYITILGASSLLKSD